MTKNIESINIGKIRKALLIIVAFLLFLSLSSSLASAATCPIQPQTGTCAPGTKSTQDLSDNPIIKDINLIVNFLSIGVGVVVIAMIIIGGIQYILAGSDVASPGKPSAVAAAKQRIVNSLIALVAYLFIFAFLQWLIPGGLFDQ